MLGKVRCFFYAKTLEYKQIEVTPYMPFSQKGWLQELFYSGTLSAWVCLNSVNAIAVSLVLLSPW